MSVAKVLRRLSIAGLALFILGSVAEAASACAPGDEACPVVLKMKPGAVSIEATGSVSGERPNYYFKFVASAAQKITVGIVGGGIETGPGIPITFPDGSGDAIFENTPYPLPATGAYILVLHANTMSDGPFGRFVMSMTIK